MNTLDAIAARLLAAGVSTETGNAAGTATWPCHIGVMPPTPDQCIAVQYSGGFPQDTHDGLTMMPTFQVAIRAGAYAHAVCEAKWIAAFNALQDSQGLSGMTDFFLVRVMNTGPISYLDDKNRQMMTMNIQAVRNRQ